MTTRPKNIQRMAIANRGEVAVRIIRACQELNIETLLLHSRIDEKSDAFRMADFTYCLGEALVQDTYLNIETTVNAAVAKEADALHPGFGFLSENAEFAEACARKKLIFVGPRPETIRLFGDKISAKKLVDTIGIPTIPGYQGEDQTLERLTLEAKRIGFPVIVKVAGGGGGRGLKVIESERDCQDKIRSAQREGESSFGSTKVFLEKYLDQAKHIEVQVFGTFDGKIFGLSDRECSVQRRHQKVIEEAGHSNIDFDIRNQILAAAVKIAEEARYLGAGTVEFLVQDNHYYFMEMNTRLQVEHPVTEFVLGVDLVKAQIMTAQGQSLFWQSEDLAPRGHAIECRICCEDPYQGGIPSTGDLGSIVFPHGPGRRFDCGFRRGDEISRFYDSMMAKVIVWDETRSRAIHKMRKTLEEMIVFGVQTNIPYLLEILNHQEFIAGSMTTRFLEKHFPEGLRENRWSEWQLKIGSEVQNFLQKPQLDVASQGPSPWFEERGPT